MNIDDIKELLNQAPKSTIIASHMDTVSHLTITRNDLRNFINKEKIKNILIPDDGETINLN